MTMPARHFNGRRRARYAALQRGIRAESRRGLRLPPEQLANLEPVKACDPPHQHGCLRCFVVRLDQGGRR